MMPGDFKLRSRYGVGLDWPISYDDLEPHYGVAEQVMLVSGPTDSPMPRSRPAPLAPHRFSDPDVLLKKHFPDGWYQMSTARASVATGRRGICCATGICGLCPVDAKFTIQNGLAEIYRDPRVTLRLRAEVKTVETAAGIAQAVNKDQRRPLAPDEIGHAIAAGVDDAARRLTRTAAQRLRRRQGRSGGVYVLTGVIARRSVRHR